MIRVGKTHKTDLQFPNEINLSRDLTGGQKLGAWWWGWEQDAGMAVEDEGKG